MSSGTTQAIEVLHKARQQLLELQKTEPLDNLAEYRDDISKEIGIAKDKLRELKEAEQRRETLEALCTSTQHLDNKMEFANQSKELDVVKNKINELNNEINHAIRNHEVVSANKKRISLEIDRLDSILHTAQIELSECGDTPSLHSEIQDYVPLDVAREQALLKLNSTKQALKNVKETLQTEQTDHRELVYNLKTEIKSTKADIEAMNNGTYTPAVEFTSRLNERRQAQRDEHDSKRTDIEKEIHDYQTQIANGDKVHQANMNALSNEVSDLEQQLSNMTSSHAAELSSLESTLTKLQEEQAANSVVLAELEERMTAEKEEERLQQIDVDKRLLEIKEMKAIEEKEYFAALWIQLRWKAYLKRKALKQSKKKGGKKKKGKKAKK